MPRASSSRMPRASSSRTPRASSIQARRASSSRMPSALASCHLARHLCKPGTSAGQQTLGTRTKCTKWVARSAAQYTVDISCFRSCLHAYDLRVQPESCMAGCANPLAVTDISARTSPRQVAPNTRQVSCPWSTAEDAALLQVKAHLEVVFHASPFHVSLSVQILRVPVLVTLALGWCGSPV